MRVHNSSGPLANEKTSLLLDNKCNKVACGGCDAPAEVGQFLDAVFSKRDTKFIYRTNLAFGVSWRANQSAKFHQGLVEMRAIRICGRARLCRAVTSFVGG